MRGTIIPSWLFFYRKNQGGTVVLCDQMGVKGQQQHRCGEVEKLHFNSCVLYRVGIKWGNTWRTRWAWDWEAVLLNLRDADKTQFRKMEKKGVQKGEGGLQQQHMVPISQLWTEECRRMRGQEQGLQSGDIKSPVIVTFTSTTRKLLLCS